MRAEAIGEISKLLYDGLPLQAYDVVGARGLGEPHTWLDVDERILAGRLLTPLGAWRRSDVLHYLAFRHHPQNARAALYYAFTYASRFGVLRALSHVRRALDTLEAEPKTRADLLAFRGYLCGTMRDFSVAHADVDAAIELLPERPWLWAEKSSVLRMEDRYEEALEAAQHALGLRPFYRVAIEQVADLFYLANRDDEAIDLLEEAAGKSEVSYIVSRLSAYYSELGEVQKTLDALDRYEALTPLADKHVTKWLARRRSDLRYLNGDVQGTIALAEATDSKYHKRLAKRLEGGEFADGKRVKLPLGFVRQHDMTCAPATLSAIAGFWGKRADHLEVAEEICYDGTPGHSERNWAEGNGYVVREFCLTWEATVALIDRGVPFTLTTVETTSAHLQAVIGYDAQIGVLLIRDPTHKHFAEFWAEGFLDDYRATGPRAMVFVPEENAELLDGIEFPEAELYDHMHALQRALESHDRPAAESEYARLKEIAPAHRMTVSAERSLASYDGDTLKIVAALDKLIEMFPKHQGFHLSKLSNMRGMWSWEEKCAFVREQLAKKKFDSVYLREMGELLGDDGRYYDEALYFFRRGLARRPRDAELLHCMAGIYWDQGRLEEATELYRFAICLEPAWEYLADSYFKATRFLRQSDEGLEFLRARFERLGGKSASPAMTLFNAYDILDRTGEGLEMLDEALRRRPEDGRLMLFASGKFSAYNRQGRAGSLLESARGFCPEQAWLQESARQATRQGDLKEAERLWLQVIAVDPLSIAAQRSYVRVLAESRGSDAALAHLESTCNEFRNSVPLHELYLDWLSDEGPVAEEPVIRHVLEISPTNNWARRELVLNLNRQGRTDEALAESEQMLAAAPNESYSHSITGHVLQRRGEDARAGECFRRALELSADNFNAVHGLIACARSDAERREVLRFVAAEFKRQVLFGEALHAFRDEAFPIMEPEELMGLVREIHTERPDLWQSWSILIDQLKAMGEGEQALDTALAMVERFPLLPRSYLELAEVHEHRGEIAKTIGALEKALEVNPHWDYAIRQLGNAHQKNGDFEKAREVLEQAVQKDPLDGSNYGYLAEIEWRLGDRDAAFDSVAKAVAVQPSYRWGWETLAEYAIDLGREEEAIEKAKGLTEMRSQEASSWDILAEVFGNCGRREEQLGALEKGIALSPRDSDLHDAKAIALARLGRFDEAGVACRPAAFGEHIPRTLLGREAWILWERGEKKGALDKIETLVAEEPDYCWAVKTLCDWCHEEDIHEKSLTYARRLVRLTPNDAVAHGYLAHALSELDRNDEAIESFTRAYELDPSYAFAGNHLFDLRLESGDLEAAEEVLERLLLHLPGRFSHGRKLQLAVKRKQHDAAFETLGEICRDPAVTRNTLEWATGSLVDCVGAHRVVDFYESVVVGGDAAFGTVEKWVSSSIAVDRIDVHKKIAGLEFGSEHRRRAWCMFFESMSGNDVPRRRRALAVWRKNEPELASSTETWEQVGYYLNSIGKYRENTVWMAMWREYDGLSQWALMQVAGGIEACKGLAKAVPVRRHALEKYGPDHTTCMHQTMVALSVAADTDSEDFDSLIAQIVADEVGDYYQFCYRMAHVLRCVRVGGVADGLRHHDLAVRDRPDWNEDRVLARAYRFVAVRALRRACFSRLGLKLVGGLFSSYVFPFKR